MVSTNSVNSFEIWILVIGSTDVLVPLLILFSEIGGNDCNILWNSILCLKNKYIIPKYNEGMPKSQCI